MYLAISSFFFFIIDIDIFTRERIPHLQNLTRRRRRSRPSLGGLYRVAKKVSFDDITVVESPTVCTSFASGYDATQTFISFSMTEQQTQTHEPGNGRRE
jgi:hypothetical protein